MAHALQNFADTIKGEIPLQRIGMPEDAAGVVLFLASRAGAWITGVTITVDGGAVISMRGQQPQSKL